MNKTFRFIGMLFVIAFLIATPILFVLSMYCVWEPFIKTVLFVIGISEFILGSVYLFYSDRDRKER